ncbi:hypothetical protein Tco_0248095 [Tanacetum coccineum]
MAVGVRKLKSQWSNDERKAANLDQRLKNLLLYHEGPSDLKENRVLDLQILSYAITPSDTKKLEINTGFINGLPKKWLSFYQSLKNANHIRDSDLASLFEMEGYTEVTYVGIKLKIKPNAPKNVLVPPTVEYCIWLGTPTFERLMMDSKTGYEPKETSVPTKEVTNPGNTSTSSSMLKNQTQVTVASNKDGQMITMTKCPLCCLDADVKVTERILPLVSMSLASFVMHRSDVLLDKDGESGSEYVVSVLSEDGRSEVL